MGNNHARKDCPAKDAICHACEKHGHYKKACRSKHIRQVTAYTDEVREANDQMEELSLGVIESETAWESKVFINNKKVSIKLDSGADVTVLSEKSYKSEFHMWPIVPTNKVLIGPCKTKIPCVGKMNARVKTKSDIVAEEVFIVPNLEKPLLSRKAGVALKLIQKVNEINEVDEVTVKVTTSVEYKQKIVREHPELFTGSGEIPGEYQIKLIENPEPFALFVPRKVSLPLLKKTKEEIEKMLQMGVFFRVDEPTPWCSPMVVTPKPNSDVQICVDLTKLNQNIRREAHSFPSVDFTLGKLAEAKFFLKLIVIQPSGRESCLRT